MSVCIVHRDGWAACDSRTTAGRSIFPDVVNKAFAANGWLVAYAGDGMIGQKAKQVVEETNYEEAVDQLVEYLDENDLDGELLMVDRNRMLVHVDGRGCFSPIDPSLEFWVVGSATSWVVGYLARVVEAEKRPLTIEDAAAAIKMAAKYDSGIDDRVKIFYLNG
jgi:hypothetical protein